MPGLCHASCIQQPKLRHAPTQLSTSASMTVACQASHLWLVKTARDACQNIPEATSMPCCAATAAYRILLSAAHSSVFLTCTLLRLAKVSIQATAFTKNTAPSNCSLQAIGGRLGGVLAKGRLTPYVEARCGPSGLLACSAVWAHGNRPRCRNALGHQKSFAQRVGPTAPICLPSLYGAIQPGTIKIRVHKH